MKKINDAELIKYFENHTEKETLEKFNIAKCTLYRRLKKLDYRKPRKNIVETRKNTISKDPEFWNKRNDKTRKTSRLRYGCTSFTQTEQYIEKTKTTNIKKYGVEWALQSEEIKNKSRSTNIKKYNVENAGASEDSIRKIKQTKLERYGDSNYNNREQISVTWTKHSLQNKHKYRCYLFNNIYFDSLPELAYYMYCIAHNIDIKRNTEKFEYQFEDKKHLYLPDFVVNNKIVEIKSDYLFNFMLIPGTVENAKYNCMLENNVEIIRTKDFNKYLKWFNKNYRKKDYKVIRK